ncbi:MAG: GNAT family N-acetyltransferase [Steroidobacteraceae bacterium]
MNAAPGLITSSAVILRRVTPEDTDTLFAFASDAEVMRFMDWAMPTDPSTVRSHLEKISAGWETGDEYQWVILEQRGGEVAGTIAVRPRGHAADFGYFLGRDYWGKGLAFDAATALFSWLDSQPQIVRVWASVDSENLRSRRLLSRLGLELEGVMRGATFRPNIGGMPRDTAIYARIRAAS